MVTTDMQRRQWEDIEYIFKGYRDELIISTKAGFGIWKGAIW